MTLQVLYRPPKIKSIIGNKDTKESLKGILKRKNIPSTFLFTGESGCGKTTFARALKNELKVKGSDFIELNAADDRGIDAIRKLREGLQYAPLEGKKKFILLDEAHMITAAAQEALLKILEEPPEHVHIALCTTNPEKLKITIKRRCHQYVVIPLKQKEMYELLHKVLKKEGLDSNKFPKVILEKIDELADGSAGQALKLLDQVIDMKSEKKALKTLTSIGASITEVKDLINLILNDKMNANTKWGKAARFVDTFTGDAENARFAILQYLSKVIINDPRFEIRYLMDCFFEKYWDVGKAGLMASCWDAIIRKR